MYEALSELRAVYRVGVGTSQIKIKSNKLCDMRAEGGGRGGRGAAEARATSDCVCHLIGAEASLQVLKRRGEWQHPTIYTVRSNGHNVCT